MNSIKEDLEEKIKNWQLRDDNLRKQFEDISLNGAGHPLQKNQLKENLQEQINLWNEISEFYNNSNDILGVGAKTAEGAMRRIVLLQNIKGSIDCID